MSVGRIGCALVQSLCTDLEAIDSINPRMFQFSFKWIRHFLRGDKDKFSRSQQKSGAQLRQGDPDRELRRRQNNLIQMGVLENLAQIFTRVTDNSILKEVVELFTQLLEKRNRKAQDTILKFLSKSESTVFLEKMMKLLKGDSDLLLEKAHEENNDNINKEAKLYDELAQGVQLANSLDYDISYDSSALTPVILLTDKDEEKGGKKGRNKEDDSMQGKRQTSEGNISTADSRRPGIAEINPAMALAIQNATSFYRFLRNLCACENEASQKLLNTTVVSEGVCFVLMSIRVFGSLGKFMNEHTKNLICEILDFLTLMVRGPNPTIQRVIQQSKFFDHLKEYVNEYSDLSKEDADAWLDPKRKDPGTIETVHEAVIVKSIKLCNAVIEGCGKQKRVYLEMARLLDADCLVKIIHARVHYQGIHIPAKLGKNRALSNMARYRIKHSKTFSDSDLGDVFEIYFFIRYLDLHYKEETGMSWLAGLPLHVMQVLQWLDAYTGSVEVVFKNQLETIFFIKHPATFMLQSKDKEDFLWSTGLNSHQNKLYLMLDFTRQAEYLTEYRYGISYEQGWFLILLNTIDKHINMVFLMFTVIANIINILTENSQDSPSILHDSAFSFGLIRVLLLLLCACKVASFLIVQAPVKLTLSWNHHLEKLSEQLGELLLHVENPTEDTEKLRRVLQSANQGLMTFGSPIVKQLVCCYVTLVLGWDRAAAAWYYYSKTIEFFMEIKELKWTFFFLLSTCFSLLTDNNFYIGLLMLYLPLYIRPARELIATGLHNLKVISLLWTLLAIVVIIFSEISFFVSPQRFFSNENGEELCENLLHCALSFFTWGIRATGGIGDKIPFPSHSNQQEFYYAMIFDWFFFLVVNLLGLNLIFGAIIDSFTDCRLRKEQCTADIKGHCFICGLPPTWFQQTVQAFSQHMKEDHNLWDYFAYIYSLRKTSKVNLHGINKKIFLQVCSQEISWLPTYRCRKLEKGGIYSEQGRHLDGILATLKTFRQNLEQLEEPEIIAASASQNRQVTRFTTRHLTVHA